MSVLVPIVKTKIKYIIKNKTLSIPYDFDEIIDLTEAMTMGITIVIFDEDRPRNYSIFNQPIVLTQHIEELTFGWAFQSTNYSNTKDDSSDTWMAIHSTNYFDQKYEGFDI